MVTTLIDRGKHVTAFSMVRALHACCKETRSATLLLPLFHSHRGKSKAQASRRRQSLARSPRLDFTGIPSVAMARTRAVRLSDTANSSPGAGPSSRPAPAKGQRSKKTSNTAAVTNDRIDVRSTASDDPSPTIAKVKAPVKPKDPCADFPDFSAPAYLASAIHPAPAAKPKKIAQAPRSPPPVIATSSLTLVNSPEHGRAANVAAQWKRSAAVKRTSKAPRKAQRKMPDLDSDCTAASSPLSSPLSSPMLARNKSLTELLGDETDEEEDRESQNLDTLFADLDKMERNKLDHVEEQIVVAMVQGLFQPSTLPDG